MSSSTPRNPRIRPIAIALGLVMAIVMGVGPAAASPIDPGFDLWVTPADSTQTSVDLTGVPQVGVEVPLRGVPVGPGNTDTIVERLTGSSAPFDPPDASVMVDIELVALHLRSQAPVDLKDPDTGAVLTQADLHIVINVVGIESLPTPGEDGLDAVAPSLGRMEIRHSNGPGSADVGGEWDSCFGTTDDSRGRCPDLGVVGGGIFALAIFTVVGGDPATPDDRIFVTEADRVVLASSGCAWQHSAPANDPRPDPEAEPFPAGRFHVVTTATIACEHDGPHGDALPITGTDPGQLVLVGLSLAVVGMLCVSAAGERIARQRRLALARALGSGFS